MNNKIDTASLFNEISQVFKKHGLPKVVGFVPNKINISLERKGDSNFNLLYQEFFTYLPNELFEASRENAINLLKNFGIKNEKITKIDNGVQVVIEGDSHILSFPIIELMLQDKTILKKTTPFYKEIKSSLNKLSELFELTYDVQSTQHVQLENYLENVNKILDDNPEIQIEIEEIINKYTKKLNQE
ncbi:hypothetical protein FJY84_03160 [Candidatus Bathyarchaeota archaeon]|nr:hypothetical protein [Candidatus Bathyarchaeota archaeon]